MRRPIPESKKQKQVIKNEILRIWKKFRCVYGAPKITQELRKAGYNISVRTVGLYMQELGIKAIYIKPWVATIQNSNYSSKLINLLDEQFNPDAPNTAWCIDTMYIPTRKGFVYLTSIMDLFSRKIIAWDLSDNLEVSNVVSLIKRAKRRRNVTRPLIMHSDRGSQFTSTAYMAATCGFNLSYSKKAYYPWDNACIESFHALIKRECLNHVDIHSFEEARRLVFDYIETFYNTVRSHSHCDYLLPVEFEKKYYSGYESKVQVA